jgi:hypothetical protein
VGVRSRSRQVNQAVFVETGEDVRGAGDEGRWKQALGYDRLQLSPTNGRLLPVKRAGACTAEVRGSNPLSSTRKSARTALGSGRPQSLDYLVR